ncbi:acyltransferase [Reinekea sp. G2M2-21]|uniref:acyltransferase n=1 Tax=Reinekea sp. G2M2-21 TaxID=2788942 RepID=UPI0018A8F6FA|nr:acyltransferase [Reinekea sp. G2M2-21]
MLLARKIAVARNMFIYIVKTVLSVGHRLLVSIADLLPPDERSCRIRGRIHGLSIGAVGGNFQVAQGVRFEHGSGIRIGDDVYIGTDSWLSGLRGGIVLEDQVMIGPKVTMVSSNHTLKQGSYRFGPGKPGAIKIGYGTWLGAGVRVMAGIEVPSSSLVCAGAVLTKTFRESGIYGGVPAGKIK